MRAFAHIAVAMWIGASVGILDLYLGRRARRWLKWTIRCRRGRRCARLVTARLEGAPPGAVVRMEYDCGGCGTRYRGEAMQTGDGTWVESDRERVR